MKKDYKHSIFIDKCVKTTKRHIIEYKNKPIDNTSRPMEPNLFKMTDQELKQKFEDYLKGIIDERKQKLANPDHIRKQAEAGAKRRIDKMTPKERKIYDDGQERKKKQEEICQQFFKQKIGKEETVIVDSDTDSEDDETESESDKETHITTH